MSLRRVAFLMVAPVALQLCGALGPSAGASGSRSARADRDHDGLSDRYERRRSHTNPRRRDTDRDRLRDRYELKRSHTNPRRRDTDRDGLSDGYEVRTAHTNPRRADSDGDGLREGYEIRVSRTSPLNTDTDRDGLSDRYELRTSRTDPLRRDTDGDGVSDGQEVLLGSDPLNRKDPPPPDGTPPNTTITSGPSGTAPTGAASFGFSSEAGATFQCRLDSGSWGACRSPKSYSGLASGAHTFEVRARDTAGNLDPTPASRTWTVAVPGDTNPPSLGFRAPLEGQTVAGTLDEASANCEALASDAGGVDRVQFYLDGALTNTDASAPYDCTIDTSAHPDGPHTIAARAYDSTGNSSQAAVSVVFDNAPPQDTTPPETSITGGPSGTVTSGSASLTFDSSETGASFECRLDGGGWAGCTTPTSYSGLTGGSHTFDVRASDAAGNTDPSPASRTWTVSVPPPSGANVFLSPGGSDSAACSQAAPCRSMNRGYQVAQPGQTVELAAGSYGDQSISRDAAKTSAGDVVFQPASGANVTVGNVTSYASHLTVKDMKATDLVARVNDPPQGTVSDITFQNMDARNFMVYSATDVTIRGGDYGPASDCGGPYGGSNNSIRRYPGAANPNNILIDGVKIHDITSYDLNACHMEGLAVFAGQNVTVRNSKFFGNSVYDMFLQGNSGPVSDLTVENNWFAAPVGQGGTGSGSSTLAFSGGSGDFANTLIRHNSFNGIISPDDNGVNPSYSNFRMVGNIGQLPWNGCSLHVTYSYNVWKSSACGTGDLSLAGVAYPYVSASNTSSLDYHLTGSSAIDRVPTSMSGPLDDIDGDPRPMGAGRDAGADEDH